MLTSALFLAYVPRILAVGDHLEFSRIEEAVKRAHPGDTIEVFPSASGYGRTAVRITIPQLSIVGQGEKPVRIDGKGFNYSGIGIVPRAIFEVEPGVGDVSIKNFELAGAHNASHNGAGVRINGSNHVTVTSCDIHGNDMGVMSNGTEAGVAQIFEGCHVHHNGNAADPGYNHNFYLGGVSATIRHCEVDHSLTGHNIKSRAHFTLVEDSYVHDSANREFDFVDSAETEAPNSNAAIVNCVVAKSPACSGNRETIHFGREKGVRNGKLWLIHCTVLTPFFSPVVALTGKMVSAELDRNVIVNTQQSTPLLVNASEGAASASVVGGWNWLSTGYTLRGTGISSRTRYSGLSRDDNLGIKSPLFRPRNLPDVGTPDPAYYLDGAGTQWEVTPAAVLGAFWRPLRH